MPDYLLAFLICLPYVLATVALVAFWRRLAHRLLFAVTASLALAGLQAWIAPGAVYVLLPGNGELTRAAAHEAFTETVITSAGAQLLLGIPFLYWLYRGLRAFNSTIDADEQACRSSQR